MHTTSSSARYLNDAPDSGAAVKTSQRILADLWSHRAVFDDQHCCFFGVSVDPEGEQQSRVQAFRASASSGTLMERLLNDRVRPADSTLFSFGYDTAGWITHPLSVPLFCFGDR